MGYNKYNNEESTKSLFNAGMAQMMRGDDLQQRLHLFSMNPTEFNEVYNDYNYKLEFNCLKGLYREVKPFLNSEEIKNADKLKEALTRFIKKNNIFITRKEKVNGKPISRLDPSTWDIIEKYLDSFATLIKKFLHEHEFDSPTKEDDDGL